MQILFIFSNRKINGVAVDTVSLDYGPSAAFPAHLFFLRENIWGIENMANVDQLPASGHTIFAVPYNIHDGSGAPTRAFALPTDEFRDRARRDLTSAAAAASFPSFAVAVFASVALAAAIN